ncbi:MAG TPA: MFS transporter, partial [Bryobacteraceae bacterium]|nr:MFS transporter [Bryobacteraceae bacterium]
GIPVEPRSWWGYVISLSVIMQVLVLPLVGAAADRSPSKKRLLGFCAFSGATATMAMFLLQGTAYLQGGILFVIANVAFGAAAVVYNSFLPEIAAPEDRDRVSSRGWGIGYFGGGLVLALNLALFSNAASLGLTEAMAVRISLFSAGAWWALWTVPALLGLRNRPPAVRGGRASPFRQIGAIVSHMRGYPRTLTFLIAYLLYNDAVQAVIALSAQFGSDELKIPMPALTMAILMVQFVAFGGAFLFSVVAARTGAKRAIVLSLLIWIGVILAIYFSVRTTRDFFVMAAIVALVLGGTQALSRALYSKMIPPGREAEYFSLYEISDKGTSWLAPLIFGLALQFTGSYRLSILSLLAFFIAGLLLLLRVDPERAAAEARGYTGGNGHAVGSHPDPQ